MQFSKFKLIYIHSQTKYVIEMEHCLQLYPLHPPPSRIKLINKENGGNTLHLSPRGGNIMFTILQNDDISLTYETKVTCVINIETSAC